MADELLFARWIKWYSEYDKKDRIISFEELAKMEENREKPQGYRTGINDLDSKMGKIGVGDIVLLSSAPKQGKTLFSLSLCKAFEEQGLDVGFFSLDMSAKELMRKFDYIPKNCYTAEPGVFDISFPDEFKEVKKADWYLPNQISMPNKKVIWIYHKIVEMEAKEVRPEVIFIDHIHKLVDRGTKDNLYHHTAHCADALKEMAKVLNLSIILLAWTSQSSHSREPHLADIHMSGEIAGAVDTILFIWRDKKTTNESFVKIEASRATGVQGEIVKVVKVGKFLRDISYRDPWEDEDDYEIWEEG